MRAISVALVLGLGFATAVGTAIAAGPDVAAAIAARQDGYKQIGRHMKALSEMAKSGQVDPAEAKLHAQAIADLAAKIPSWFPPGSGAESGLKTAAKPEIWSDHATFLSRASDLEAAATGKLLPAAASGNAAQLGAAMEATGAACGACHKLFKARD